MDLAGPKGPARSHFLVVFSGYRWAEPIAASIGRPRVAGRVQQASCCRELARVVAAGYRAASPDVVVLQLAEALAKHKMLCLPAASAARQAAICCGAGSPLPRFDETAAPHAAPGGAPEIRLCPEDPAATPLTLFPVTTPPASPSKSDETPSLRL